LVGFTDYTVSAVDLTPHSIIDIFWTDGQQTAWEIFSDLSKSAQVAIYFDAYGKLQVKTREKAFADTASVFTLRSTSVPGGQPANIIDVDDTSDYEANRVLVNWKPTNFSEKRDNVVPFEVIWEPDSDIVLRASELQLPITSGSQYITLTSKDASTWPFKGICQIEGEWIEYEGKHYYYYNGATRLEAIVETQAEKDRLDAITGPFALHMNNFSGKLKIKTRGLYNTDPQDHNTALTGWTKSARRNYAAAVNGVAGFVQNHSSTMTISQTSTNYGDYRYLHRGLTTDAGYARIGTRLRIDRTTHVNKTAGLFFNAIGGVGTGYFIEVVPTVVLEGGQRTWRNEVLFYAMKTDGSKYVNGGSSDQGAMIAVTQGVFVDIDVYYIPGTTDRIQIWVNGKYQYEAQVSTASGFKQASNAKFGVYVRGDSQATFDYVYAISSVGNVPLDDESYLDRIEGAWRGDQWMDDWVYEWRYVTRKVKGVWTKAKQRYQQRFFDEFGPVVHEIRKFDVKFEGEMPSLESRLYWSNTSQVVAMEFWTDPSNAHFFLGNKSRQNAVVSGDDTLTAGGNTINHKLFVMGRPVIQKDQQTVTKTDDYAIKRRGTIEVTYDSPWIQNEDAANSLGDWLTTNWTRADSELTVNVFGNPLLELTDVVRVIHPAKNIDENYWVTAIDNDLDEGLKTSLVLRRIG
jgi:hypothetical protein